MRICPLSSLALFAALVLPAALTAHAQTDIAFSGFGTITQKATGNGMTQTNPTFIGGMVEFRHLAGALKGFEGAYSVGAPESHIYTSSLPLSPRNFTCTSPCSFTPAATPVEAYSQTLSFDWVPSKKIGNLRPFAVLGVGFQINVPVYGQVTVDIPNSTSSNKVPTPFATTTQYTAAYVYGAGVDWNLKPRLGIRLQYRGSMYKDPDLVPSLFPATGSFVQSAQPSIGIFFHL